MLAASDAWTLAAPMIAGNSALAARPALYEKPCPEPRTALG
jgi:hypothetical protein